MHSLLTSLTGFKDDQNYVLAILVNTKGSTYRKTGAMMLINQNLTYWGLLSGGCLEGDIIIHSESVFSKQQDKTIVYNMRDEADMLWGMGMGCDGEVTILLKYLPATKQYLGFFDALESINSGINYSLSIDQQNENQIIFSPDKQKNHLIADAKTSNKETSGKLVISLQAPHHLLICGGSPDVPPVTAIAHQIGWKTTVIDHRKDYADKNKFPFANCVKHIKRSAWNELDLNEFDSAIIMSHQFERDQSYLKRLINSSIQYLGLLGPAKRRDKLLKECGYDFSELKGRVFGPIGLDIGADSPQTIALAIISEIQAVINNKQVGFCYQDASR